MAISKHVKEEVKNFLIANEGVKNLAQVAADKHGISISSVYRIAENNDIKIKKYSKWKLDYQSEKFLNKLLNIASEIKADNGKVVIRGANGKFISKEKFAKLMVQ